MHVLSLLSDLNAWAALVTLTALEIVLGIDNLVFISVLTARLPQDKARRARQVGLSLAFIFRVIMLVGLTWLMGLTAPLFSVFGMGNILARHHPDRWRHVSHRQGDARDP